MCMSVTELAGFHRTIYVYMQLYLYSYTNLLLPLPVPNLLDTISKFNWWHWFMITIS